MKLIIAGDPAPTNPHPLTALMVASMIASGVTASEADRIQVLVEDAVTAGELPREVLCGPLPKSLLAAELLLASARSTIARLGTRRLDPHAEAMEVIALWRAGREQELAETIIDGLLVTGGTR